MFDSRETLAEGSQVLSLAAQARHVLLIGAEGALLASIRVDGGNLDGHSVLLTMGGGLSATILDQAFSEDAFFCPGEEDLILLARQTIRVTFNAQESHWYVAGV